MGIIGKEVTRRYKAGVKFTDAECESMEKTYLTRMVSAMQTCAPQADQQQMTYGEWIIYGHWAYNPGTKSFCNSTLGRRLGAGDRVGACKSMGAWTYITLNGRKRNCRDPEMKRICSGIVTRRDLEASMCLEAL